MTKKQYLEARIAEINSELNKKYLPPKYRKNQQHALIMYKNDLEREKALNNFN
ncbi:MAG: hypothetical protein IJB86_02675 [Clostridia bacterium]|nr:hypothetical protein [Clostridia bacterium]